MDHPIDLRAHLRSLTGETIHTITGRPNTVIKVDSDSVHVGTERSPAGEPVAIAEIESAYEELVRAGEVVITPESVGYRSAFIGAALSSIPGTETGVSPPVVKLRKA